MPRALLTIAGTDPTSGAGVAADLAVFSDFGFHGLSVPTALLDQDSSSVHAFEARPAAAVAAEVARILEVGRPRAVKVGVLASSEVATAVSEVLAPHMGDIPLVLDPVLASGLGRPLGDATLVAVVRDALLPLAAVVTPNAPEAAALAACPVDDVASARAAARRLRALGARAVLLKGGHLPDAPGDVWAEGDAVEWLPNEVRFAADVHGTGCHLSSALAALLALGHTPRAAAIGARRYLTLCVPAAAALEGDAGGRPVIVHGEPTRAAARAARQRDGS